MGRYLMEFNVGDVVTNNDGEVFEIKQKFKTGSIKVFVKECEEHGYFDLNHNRLTENKHIQLTEYVELLHGNWFLQIIL